MKSVQNSLTMFLNMPFCAVFEFVELIVKSQYDEIALRAVDKLTKIGDADYKVDDIGNR